MGNSTCSAVPKHNFLRLAETTEQELSLVISSFHTRSSVVSVITQISLKLLLDSIRVGDLRKAEWLS